MNFILWPDDANTFFIMHVRFENGKYLGDTYYGEPIINFTPSGLNPNGISHTSYAGWSGGDGPTRLNCNNSSCSGTIDGHNARFNMTVAGGVETLSGVMNFYRFEMKKSARSLNISSSGAGSVYMDKQSDGNFDGDAYYFTDNGIRRFRARLEGEGCMSSFSDDPMLIILLASPLTVATDVDAGVGR